MWNSRQFLAAALALAVAAGATAVVAAQEKTGEAKTTKAGTRHAMKAPKDEGALGRVTLTHAVLADGKPLPKGTYQVRLGGEELKPAPGTAAGSEVWVEFLQKGQVKGREVATVIPQSDIKQVAKTTPPPKGGEKVQVLKGGDYIRIWIHHGDKHYLVNFPPEGGPIKK